MKRIFIVALVLAASLTAVAAHAQTGYAVTNANLRAGPDSGYPRIGGVPSGAPLYIYGCVDDWSWCDVEWRDERGWISAGLVEYEYSGRRVDLYDHGALIGLPILAFVLDTYWSNHYRHRSWYHERDRWRGHRRQSGPPPRARNVGGGSRALPDRGPSSAGRGNSQRSPQVQSVQRGGGSRAAQGGRPSGGPESRSGQGQRPVAQAQGQRPAQGQGQGQRQERREEPRKGQGQGKDKNQDKDRRGEYRPD